MIKTIRNVYLVGTSHIAQQSIREVKSTILEQKPKVVALELDPKRFIALMSPKRKPNIRDIKQFGIRGFLLNLIGAFAEKKLGKLVNTPPGSEIKEAVKRARDISAEIALIDQDITVTLKRLTTSLTWREKVRFAKDILLAMIKRKPKIAFDLMTVPDEAFIQKLTAEVKKNYPSIYQTLIEERDVYMAKALNNLSARYPTEKIVAVVGAGHVKGICKALQKHEH